MYSVTERLEEWKYVKCVSRKEDGYNVIIENKCHREETHFMRHEEVRERKLWFMDEIRKGVRKLGNVKQLRYINNSNNILVSTDVFGGKC
jgi:hypothetical protein